MGDDECNLIFLSMLTVLINAIVDLVCHDHLIFRIYFFIYRKTLAA